MRQCGGCVDRAGSPVRAALEVDWFSQHNYPQCLPRMRAELVNGPRMFDPQRSLVPRRAFRFVWVTCCALYGVQNLVIGRASSIASAPVDQLAATCQRVLSLSAGHEDLIARNLVKILATVASMTWNYCWYRFYVFKD
jgi:hypothetical protein